MSYVSIAAAHLRAGFEERGGLCLSVFHAFGENLQITIQIVISAWWIQQDAGRGRTRLPSNTQTFHRQWHRFLTIRRIFLYPNLPRDMKTALQKITKKQQILILMILRYSTLHQQAHAVDIGYLEQGALITPNKMISTTSSEKRLWQNLTRSCSSPDWVSGIYWMKMFQLLHKGGGILVFRASFDFRMACASVMTFESCSTLWEFHAMFLTGAYSSTAPVEAWKLSLHNTNKWPSIPLAHSVHMSENYDNVKVSYIHIELI